MQKHSSPAFAPSFQCSFICSLWSLCFLFSLLRGAPEKVNVSSTSTCCGLDCSETFFTFLFHMDTVDVWSWQIWTFLHIKVMALVAPPHPLLRVFNCAVENSSPLLFGSAELVEGKEKSHDRAAPPPRVITVTSPELAERQPTWPKRKRKNSYIGLIGERHQPSKGAVVFLLCLLEQGLFTYGHPEAEKLLSRRNRLFPPILYSFLRSTALRFCCGSLQLIQIPGPWSAKKALFSAAKLE